MFVLIQHLFSLYIETFLLLRHSNLQILRQNEESQVSLHLSLHLQQQDIALALSEKTARTTLLQALHYLHFLFDE